LLLVPLLASGGDPTGTRVRAPQQGVPPITLELVDERLDFRSETGEFMLRARAVNAIEVVWPTWQDHVVDLASSA
jgi:hypothetical protein